MTTPHDELPHHESRCQECQQKHQAVTAYMASHHLDAVILTRRCNFAWYTAGGSNHVSTASDVGNASLLITPDRAICITNRIEAPRITDEELTDLGIEVRQTPWHDAADTARCWREAIGNRRAACDVRVTDLPDTIGLLPTDFDHLRWPMTETEITRYRTLAQETAECLEQACRQARPGMTEHGLAGRIAAGLIERGIRAPALLVAADERVERYRHPLPTAKSFNRYGMAVCGSERHGLHVSCTRLFSFGPITADLRRRHDAVCQVDAAMIAATRPGNTLRAILAVAQNAYAEAGFPDEWKLHHQGGPTGYLGREVKATPYHHTQVLTHQVYAWNPSITGTKSEDTIFIATQHNEILTATGQWPTTTYAAGGRTWDRSDILEL